MKRTKAILMSVITGGIAFTQTSSLHAAEMPDENMNLSNLMNVPMQENLDNQKYQEYIEKYMNQYNSYIQGSNQAITSATDTLKKLAEKL